MSLILINVRVRIDFIFEKLYPRNKKNAKLGKNPSNCNVKKLKMIKKRPDVVDIIRF